MTLLEGTSSSNFYTTPPNPDVAMHIQKWIQGLKFALMGELINSGSDTQQERYRNKEVPSVRWSQGIILAGLGTEPILTPQSAPGDIKEYEVDYSHVSGTLLEEVRYTSKGATVATLSYLDKALENLRESEHKNIEVYILSQDGLFDAEDYRIKQFALKWQEGLGKKLVIKTLYRHKPKDTTNISFRGEYTGHNGRKKEATRIVTLRNTTIYEEGYALPGLSPHKDFNKVSKTVNFGPLTIHLENRTSTTPYYRTTPKEENGKRQTDYSGAKLVDSLKQVPPEAATHITRILSSALISANIVREENITSYQQAQQQFSLVVNNVTPEQFDIVRRELHLALDNVRKELHQKKLGSDNKLGISSDVTELAAIENSIQKWLQGTKFAMFSKVLKELQRERLRLIHGEEQKADSVSASLAMISVNGSPHFFRTDTTYPGDTEGQYYVDYASVSKLSRLPEIEHQFSHNDAEVATVSNIEIKLVKLLESRKDGNPYKTIEINILSVLGACNACDYMLKQFAKKWQNKGLCNELIVKLYYNTSPRKKNAKGIFNEYYTKNYGRPEESA